MKVYKIKQEQKFCNTSKTKLQNIAFLWQLSLLANLKEPIY